MKSIVQLFLFVLILLESSFAWANFKMDIRVLRKGGIDSGLVLASEYYYSEWVPLGQEFSVRDRAGQFILTIRADFIKEEIGIDITNKIELNGYLQTKNNEQPTLLSNEPVHLMMGEPKEFNIKQDDEREFNIKLTPRRP